jgi:pimeloyl-ACP methyl ester carboxylesterase
MSDASIVSRIAHQTFLHSPSTMPKGRWWKHLESNFSERPEGFELEPFDWLRVAAAAAGDRVVRTYGGALLSATIPAGLMPSLGWGGLSSGETTKDWDLYAKLANSDNPGRFFREPPKRVDITSYKPRWGYFVPENGQVEGLKFKSPYKPFNPRMRGQFSEHSNNGIARARYWRHDDGPRPTLLGIHGFMADPYWLNEHVFALREFYEQGFDVVLFTMPHHGLRREPSSMFSGHGFFSSGMSGVNEHMGQAICDLRVLMRYLREQRGVTKIGATGVSLGGWTTALLATVVDDLEFALPNVPVASPVDLLLEWEPAGTLLRTALFATRRSVKDLREILAVSTPLTHEPKLATERLMIIGGIGDRLAPPKHSRLLWDHWNRCRIHWFPGSHFLHLDRGEYMAQMHEFMQYLEFAHTPRKSRARVVSIKG